MSEATDAQEAEAVLLPPEDTDKGDQTNQTDASADDDDEAVEAEALAMGWKPQSSFKGPADKFVSAREYVERGKTIMPFLRNELKRRDREIEQLKGGLTTAIQQLSRADERAYAKAKAELEAELAQYAEAGNKQAVKEVTDDLIALEKDRIAGEKPEKPAAGEVPPEMQAWMDENPWYGKDRALTAACDAIGQEVFEEGITGKAQIKEVDRRLREQFPAKFAKPENPNRRLPGAVEGGGGRPASGAKTFADLPPDAKQMCDELCRDMPKLMTRDKFVKEYFAQEARK